jgi:hypothetical protein
VDLTEKVDELRDSHRELAPKAAAYDVVYNSQQLYTLKDAAKLIDIQGMGPQNIYYLLHAVGHIYYKHGEYTAKQDLINRGFMKQCMGLPFMGPEGYEVSKPLVKMTNKCILYYRTKLATLRLEKLTKDVKKGKQQVDMLRWCV